jgi:hypothetical protein
VIIVSLDLKLDELLNRKLNIKIYMDQLVGFVVKDQKCKNYRLHKFIYELKQSFKN